MALAGAGTGHPSYVYWAARWVWSVTKTKMSKSLGNWAPDVTCSTWDPVVVRRAVLAHHHRSDWEWDHHQLSQAATVGILREPRLQCPSASLGDEVRAALDDDLTWR